MYDYNFKKSKKIKRKKHSISAKRCCRFNWHKAEYLFYLGKWDYDVKGEYIPKLAELLGVEIKDLFEVSPSKIQINQKNSDNKDNSINGLVFILTDEKSIDQIVSVLKNNIQNKNV